MNSSPPTITALDAAACVNSLELQLREFLALPQVVRNQVFLVGIHTGGAWVAEKLHQTLGLTTPLGFLSSAFHRDDFNARGLASTVKATDLAFDINGAHILLVDDVLYTGRTIRACMNELFDHGRPSAIDLVVLVDRGGRQLPIEARFVGQKVVLTPEQQLVLAQDTTGRLSLAIETQGVSQQVSP